MVQFQPLHHNINGPVSTTPWALRWLWHLQLKLLLKRPVVLDSPAVNHVDAIPSRQFNKSEKKQNRIGYIFSIFLLTQVNMRSHCLTWRKTLNGKSRNLLTYCPSLLFYVPAILSALFFFCCSNVCAQRKPWFFLHISSQGSWGFCVLGFVSLKWIQSGRHCRKSQKTCWTLFLVLSGCLRNIYLICLTPGRCTVSLSHWERI